MKKTSDLCELMAKLVCSTRDALSKGIQNVNTHELGEATDMIKDLAEAEEKCWKACYYKKIVEAMEEESEMEEMMAKMGHGGEGRMGYDHYRYASGRFAPKGHGHYSAGYDGPIMHEMHDEDPWMMTQGGDQWGGKSGHDMARGSSNERMGYSGSDRGHRYDRYEKARMGYHQSKDATSKEHMDSSAREYVVDAAESIREIWKDADPAMRKELKSKLSGLVAEMN